ncbi:MAG: PhoU domain-containing protein, partial [Pseudomonadota bacterium]|nr:PhoU domain-containing protein [Pseudomonadota bacterium]
MSPTSEHYGKHTSQQFDADLDNLHRLFMGMGGLVEQQVADAVHALLDLDVELAMSVQHQDAQVNKFETDLDEALALVL